MEKNGNTLVSDRKPVSIMSKKRYAELQVAFTRDLRTLVPDLNTAVGTIMSSVCEVMRYDPIASRYTPELGQMQVAARRTKRASLSLPKD